MAVRVFTNGIEPADQNSEIWRFITLEKLEKLLKGELYFRRADLFDDETEGLPPEEYERVLKLSRYDLNDIQERNSAVGFIAGMRQSHYLNCWYLFDEEKAEMWKNFARNGVAMRSTYARLKAVMNAMPDEEHPTLGQVRYGSAHINRWNTDVFISTKKKQYAHEREVRAMLWVPDPHEGGNRHIDIDNWYRDRPIYDTPNPRGINRPVDLNTLIVEMVVSPYADAATQRIVETMIADAGYSLVVRESDLKRFAALLP